MQVDSLGGQGVPVDKKDNLASIKNGILNGK